MDDPHLFDEGALSTLTRACSETEETFDDLFYFATFIECLHLETEIWAPNLRKLLMFSMFGLQF